MAAMIAPVEAPIIMAGMCSAVAVLGLLTLAVAGAVTRHKADVCVYGSTASGVIAAVASSREGANVLFISPSGRLGGMVSGGLSATDHGNASVIGGLAHEFFNRLSRAYGLSDRTASCYYFEPHVAERVFGDMIREAPVPITLINDTLASAAVDQHRIVGLALVSGAEATCSAFVDASYEGDLLAAAGVTYTWGREGNATYNESFAGRLREPSQLGHHQFPLPVPHTDKDGHLLPLIETVPSGSPGQGDRRVQSYNYRLCVTKNTSNRVPFARPASYNHSTWQLLRNYVSLINNTKDLTLSHFSNLHATIHGKYDLNNNGAISTDFIGQSWRYPTAGWTERRAIIEAHKQYTQGLLYTLGNDAALPEALRKDVSTYGLCADEFESTENWPFQLYVREARRMRGEFVFTQHDRSPAISKADSIGLGSYNIDTHHAQRYADGAWVYNEGDVEVGYKYPEQVFQIPYRVMLPSASEITNLVVPVCVSASHIGYGALRLEPQYMIMGQAAGLAAAVSVKSGSSVQNVDARLRAAGAILQEAQCNIAYEQSRCMPEIALVAPVAAL